MTKWWDVATVQAQVLQRLNKGKYDFVITMLPDSSQVRSRATEQP